MKYFLTLVMALTLSTGTQASDLSENALKALLNTPGLVLDGDVHSDETVAEIYQSGVEAGASIENKCAADAASKTARCTLWINYNPIGETAIEYSVNLPGNTLSSKFIYVARGV